MGVVVIKQKPIQIFSDNNSIGINVVKSPVKLTILEMLRTCEMEFDEIVTNTGKSKSTISVHLKALKESGIISYKMDPQDNRKKIFFINSMYLGSVDSENKDIKEVEIDYLIDNLLDTERINDFYMLLFHTLRAMLIKEGISIDPILYNTGKRIGEVLFKKLKADTLDEFASNITEFWETRGLGKLDIKLGQVIKIKSVDCFECEYLPKTGKPACFLDAGILESLFNLYFGMPLNVTEVKCYTMGDNQCTFEIEATSIEK